MSQTVKLITCMCELCCDAAKQVAVVSSNLKHVAEGREPSVKVHDSIVQLSLQ